MRINKIKMAGFRGATNAVEIKFDAAKRVTLVFGENGTGKSTIADALDFLCNGKFGSLEDYSVGNAQAKKKLVKSVGRAVPPLKVDLETSSGTWSAVLGTDGPRTTPMESFPNVKILRRKTVQALVDEQPKARFERLREFISVPRIEGAETSLREAIKTLDKDVSESVRALDQASTALKDLWISEGHPGENPEDWARGEIGVATTEHLKTIAEINVLARQFGELSSALVALGPEKTALSILEGDLKGAEEALEVEQQQHTAGTIELLKLLDEARSYIERHNTESACPVCEQRIDPNDVVSRIGGRMSKIRHLKELSDAVELKRKQLDLKRQLVERYQKSLITKAREIAKAITDSLLPEVTGAGIDWKEKYEELWSDNGDLGQLESLSAAYREAVNIIWSSVEDRRKTAEKSINLREAIAQKVKAIDHHRQKSDQSIKMLGVCRSLVEIISAERKAFIEGLLEKISTDVERLYTALHPGENIGGVKFYMKPKAIGSLEFDAAFHGEKEIPPQAYYSESHLDTLAICIFLSLSRHFSGNGAVLVLDDVFTSVDSVHLDRFMKLLHSEAQSFGQVIVTTHYRPWRDRYKWARGQTANIQVIELGPWSLETGIQVGEFIDAISELRRDLSSTPMNRQALASRAGILLESVLDLITLRYKCRVPRIATNEYTLGDLVNAIDSKLSSALKIRKMGEAGAIEEIVLKDLFGRATRQTWVRNAVGCHFNRLGSEVSDSDVKDFANDTLTLATAIVCGRCGSLPTKRPSGSYWECGCGKLEMLPLIQPGGDPRSVADEG